MAACEHDSYNKASYGSMKLKVLYTFDVENQRNHLARWPEVLSIKKYIINETTTIGVVELQTCLRAIVQASPEIISGASQDYTIYAHDFSECDFPLVGQGLLSNNLKFSSSSPTACPDKPKPLLTGRISNDVNCIFTSGIKETLEVKMRLVPMTSYERRQIDVTCKCKQLSCTASSSTESIEWNPIVPRGLDCGANSILPKNSANFQQEIESNQNINSFTSNSKFQKTKCSTTSHNGTTEDSGNESTETLKITRKSTKTSKSSSKRSRSNISRASIVGGCASSYEEVTEGEEAIAPKKRAKVQKIQRSRKSTFVPNPDSLRVAVGTSDSMRLFKPIAKENILKDLAVAPKENKSRVPTPAPYLSEEQENISAKPRLKLKLRRDSDLSYNSSRPIGKLEDQLHYSTESMDATPERSRSPFDIDTPPGMTSSPPVIKVRSPTRMISSPTCPSSPCLPQLPRLDSGLMGGSYKKPSTDVDTNIFGERILENKMKKVKKIQKRRDSLTTNSALKQGQKEFIIEEECPGPMDQLPTKMPIFRQQARARCATLRNKSIMSDDIQFSLSNQKDRNPSCKLKHKNQSEKHISTDIEDEVEPTQSEKRSMISTKIWPTSQAIVPITSKPPISRIAISASDPILPQNNIHYPQNMHGKLNSFEVQKTKYPSSIQPSSVQSFNGQNTATNSQSSSKKEMIKLKLETAIANGEMPPFCCNCGAIETPTWRKAWSKEMKGEPGYYEYSDEPGRVTAIIILTRDSEGKPTSYNLIKKYLGKDENQDDYNDYLLCNPCGIWMSKYKTSRPEERWESSSEKTSKAEPKKRPTQRVSRPKKSQNSLLPTPVSEASYFPSDGPSVLNDTTKFTERVVPEEINKTSISLSTQNKPRSIRFLGTLANKSLDSSCSTIPSAIQSSPVRSIGTLESPIDLEDDLGNIRRLLFSSPQKSEATKILGEAVTNSATKSKRVTSTNETQTITIEKENLSPKNIVEENIDAQILQLFEEELPEEDKQRHKTPTQKSLAAGAEDQFKTPTCPSPTSRMITRSMSKSARSTKSSRKLIEFCQTPVSVKQRQTPKSDEIFESPFTTTLNQLISDAKKPNSPVSNADFASISTFPELVCANLDINMDFSVEDFFSTDLLDSNTCPTNFSDLGFNANSLDSITADITWQDLDFSNYNTADALSIGSVNRPNTLPELKEQMILENRDEDTVVTTNL